MFSFTEQKKIHNSCSILSKIIDARSKRNTDFFKKKENPLFLV